MFCDARANTQTTQKRYAFDHTELGGGTNGNKMHATLRKTVTVHFAVSHYLTLNLTPNSNQGPDFQKIIRFIT